MRLPKTKKARNRIVFWCFIVPFFCTLTAIMSYLEPTINVLLSYAAACAFICALSGIAWLGQWADRGE